MTSSLGSFSQAAIDHALLEIARLAWSEEPARFMRDAETFESFGSYTGLPPRVALLADGRNARLLAPISYRQPTGEDWPVDTGSMLDGASIPRFLWSLIGGPFEGRYRDASIVHDHYCVSRDRPWRAVHRMFYEAMRCSGVAPAKAKIIYYAVYRFGPRWEDAASAHEALAGAAVAEAPVDDAALSSLVADAKAIYTHDLSIDEIETLANTRDSMAAPVPIEAAFEVAVAAPSAALLGRARLLVVPGGSGDASDVEAVAIEAVKLPEFVMSRFEKMNIRIIACRDSVTDFEVDLKGITPRGWEGTGRTWDNVPGTYFDDRKRVVIATIDQGGARIVPTSASRLHGSACLVVHESLHGYDYSRNHEVLGDPQFLAARDGDLSHLGAYELQAGQPGLEETFAESGARFVTDRAAMATDWTHLCNYWGSDPAELESIALERLIPAPPLPPEADDGTIGSAKMDRNGNILLDLRAEAPGGAIGHALLEIPPDDPAYQALHDRLFPTKQRRGEPHGKVPFRRLADPR